MNNSDPAGLERSGTTNRTLSDQIDDAIARSYTVGIDAEGRRHHYYAPADTVVVSDEDGVDHREYLNGRTVEAWANYVADTRGWNSYGPHAKLGERVDAKRKAVA